MNTVFTSVNVLIWDVDGTLYPFTEGTSQAVLESAYLVIERYTAWPRHKTIEEFEKVHNRVTLSQTEAVAIICSIPIAQAAKETDHHFNRTQYVKRDDKLIALFEQFRGFRHFILGNGAQKTILEGLTVLGLSASVFDEIVTSETVGVNKPKDNGFRYIMEKTGLPPAQHLMIGDREKVDLVPAHALGMKTCLVWSLKPGMIADITLPSVYELAQILS